LVFAGFEKKMNLNFRYSSESVFTLIPYSNFLYLLQNLRQLLKFIQEKIYAMILKPFLSGRILLPVLLSIIIAGCIKSHSSNPSNPEEALIHQAMQFFTDSVDASAISSQSAQENPRLACRKFPQWSAARTVLTSAGMSVVVPIQYEKPLQVRTNFSGNKLLDLGELTQMLIYRDILNHFHAQIITAFPDNLHLTSGQSTFTGILFVEDWAGNRLSQLKSITGGSVLTFSPTISSKSKPFQPATENQVAPNAIISTCYQITGYNYSESDPDGGESWTEPAGCDYSYVPDEGVASYSGLSSSDYTGIATVGRTSIYVASGTNPIGNIQDYFKCFTNIGGNDHLYTVMLCVDQPDPGTREPWGFSSGPDGTSATGNPVDVGHTFLVFTESYGGTTIARNVGFYPAGNVTPVYPSDQGQLDNNASSIYNISLTITLTNAQFFTMLNFVEQGNNPGYLYNLNSNNCTTFALNALASGGVDINSTKGSWPGGSGFDPGDLGQDIQSMALDPDMTRNTVESAHPNLGTCN
jgi:hypothetical protein